MGYYVYITRRGQADDVGATAIPVSDWMSYVESDQEFQAYKNLDEVTKSKAGPGRIDGLAAWMAYTPYLKTGEVVWFDWFDGEISVKNPDTEIVRKMVQIAMRLDAKVIGDSDEQYGADGEAFPDTLPSVANRRWWQFWK